MNLPVDYRALSPSARRMVRKEYEAIQGGVCSHCKCPLSESPPEDITRLRINKELFPPRFFEWPVHLHHAHDTGMTLGAVHAVCNAVLWQYHGE